LKFESCAAFENIGKLTTIYEYEGSQRACGQTSRTGINLNPVPLGARGELEAYVGPVLFLASDWANFIAGVDLPVEGGRMVAR
jgi:NAD(P)-dependent dehydrogenase (short-subunit alcohol dehydrogenase family)